VEKDVLAYIKEHTPEHEKVIDINNLNQDPITEAEERIRAKFF
jgi:hypothetical protein